MKSKKHPKLVLIKWHDAYSSHYGWAGLSDIGKPEPMEVLTVGHLIFEDKKHVTVAQNVSNIESFADTMVIPKACIVSRKNIRGQ